jgi:outer membrane receptor for ferrienterochelin and colicin
MRWILILFLLISGACESQTLLNRPVTLVMQQGKAGELLNELNQVTGITISYSSEVIDLEKKVRLTGQEKIVEEVLKSILKDQPVRYLEQNGKIFLLSAEPVKKKFTIKGYVTDAKSGERLIGTSLFVTETSQGTTSNVFGFFSLTLELDSLELVISHAGYITETRKLQLTEDMELDIALQQRVILNEIVVVNAESKTNTQNRTIPGKISVSSSLVKSIPGLFGEADVLKSLQLLPGIQAGNEGMSGFNVRGGSADQNLVLLDGVPVYNASHAFGLFSVFNADAVHNVEVLKGGFPASYGGRLSSVIDVQMKEGDKYNFHGEGGLGLIFSKLTLEGPLKKGRSSFLISGRRTYADLLIKPIQRLSKDPDRLSTFFSDFMVKTNFGLSKGNHIYFSFYTGKDKYLSKIKSTLGYSSVVEQLYTYGFSWGNITGMARWNHEFNKKLFSNLTFNYSRFGFNALDRNNVAEDNSHLARYSEEKYLSSIQDYNVKYDIDFLPSPDHFIKFGLAATLHHYRPGERSLFQSDTVIKTDRIIRATSLYAGEYDLYAEDDIRFSTRMKANLGIRVSGFNPSGEVFVSLQPRISWIYKLTNRWSLKASAVKMSQYIHLLTNSNMGMPTDLWLPVTKRAPPQRSYQGSAGVSYNPDQSLEASMEVYYKQFRNVIEYKEGAGLNSISNNWEDVIDIGKGKTYGAEWFLQKRKGKLTGLVSYTLSWSRRKFENINGGREFPFKYDKRHEVKTAFVFRASSKMDLGCDWVLSTGNPISLPVAYYTDPYTSNRVDIYSGRNDFRMPLYHRMDISMKLMKQKKKFLRTWVISVYNVYNHHNPFYIYNADEYVSPNTFRSVFKQVSLFPIIPTISYQFKF